MTKHDNASYPKIHRLLTITGLIATALLMNACLVTDSRMTKDPDTTWKPLYNKKDLSGFDTYLGTSLGEKWEDISAAATRESVFSIVEVDGDKVIRISGEINGSLATRESFENYHLRLVFKWGEIVHKTRNSGLLYHSFGKFGEAHGTWMPNIEFQMMHENLGDTYLMVNTACEIPALKNEDSKQWIYTRTAEPVAFGRHANGPLIRKSINAEMPIGEWNVVDLYCYGRTAVHVVNGQVVMINTMTGTFVDDSVLPLTSGKIQLQSEGGEFFIKSLDIRPIDSIPDSLLK